MSDPITWTRPEDQGEYGRDAPPRRLSTEEWNRYLAIRNGDIKVFGPPPPKPKIAARPYDAKQPVASGRVPKALRVARVLRAIGRLWAARIA